MYDQFGLYVGPGYVGAGGDTIQSISLANGGDGSGGWDDPGVSNQYAGNQQDLGAIRQLMGTQGAGYLVTGNASLSNGGDSTAYLPQMMQKAGINPTQGILNSYQGVTGQAYQPGSQTAYNPQSGGYDISGVTNAVGALGSGISNLGNQFGSVTSQLGQLGGQFDQFGNQITSGIGSLGTQLGQVGNQFSSGLSQLGTNLASQFDTGFSKFGEQLGSQFGNLNNSLSSLAQQMTQKDPELEALNSNFGSFLDMYKKQFERAPYQPKAYEKSPYVDQMVQATTDQVNDNWKRQVQPTIASQAQSVGGYGGSRQGVVEANALNDINRNLASTTANIYQTDYENQQNRNLQEYAANNNMALGMGGLALNAANASNQNQLNLGNLGLGIQNSNQGYNLGLGNLGLNAQNSQNNFYTAQRGQDLQQAGLGASMVNQANQGYLNQGSGIYEAGSVYQQAPWGTIGNFNSATTPYTGYGATTTQSQSANPWAQALGGAIAGGQLGRLF